MSKRSVYNIHKISTALTDGLASIGQQQNVRKCYLCKRLFM